MKFFYPDSQDFVDPLYDLETETHPPHRIRQRDDAYAHELLEEPPYDGLLISKSIVDARRGRGRYSDGQRQRLLRAGAHRFLRARSPALLVMGDCGAYAYLEEETPPYSIGDLLDFYQSCGFDQVLSLDHVVPHYRSNGAPPPAPWRRRQEMTLQFARAFRREHRARECSSVRVGVAQGWSPSSYVRAARALEKMGYDYIALGGLAPLSTQNIMAVVEAVGTARRSGTRLHLLGVARPDHFGFFRQCGVASFDSTMPLRQAFMDDRHNYHTMSGAYLAIRLPQVAGNRQLQRKVRRGVISGDQAFKLERAALQALRRFDAEEATLGEALTTIQRYEHLFNGRDQTDRYRALLEDRPWKQCPCAICRQAGIDVVLLRGRERNKRRGFHNMSVLSRKLAHASLRW